MKGGRNKEGFVSIVRGLEEANKSSVSQGEETRKLNSYIGRLVRVKSEVTAKDCRGIKVDS